MPTAERQQQVQKIAQQLVRVALLMSAGLLLQVQVPIKFTEEQALVMKMSITPQQPIHSLIRTARAQAALLRQPILPLQLNSPPMDQRSSKEHLPPQQSMHQPVAP